MEKSPVVVLKTKERFPTLVGEVDYWNKKQTETQADGSEPGQEVFGITRP
jgi:hypothetical protein